MQPDSEEPPTLPYRGLQPNSAEPLLVSRSATAHSRRSFPSPHSHAQELNPSFHPGAKRTTGLSVRDARSSLRFLRCLPMASNGAAPCPPLPAFPLAPAPAPPPRGCEPSSALLLLLLFSPPLPGQNGGAGNALLPSPRPHPPRHSAEWSPPPYIWGEPLYTRP